MTTSEKKPETTREYIKQQIDGLSKNPDCGATHYNLAIGLINQGKFADAEEELLAAVNSSPTLGEAYVALGGLALQKGNLEGCILYNKKAIDVRPKFAPAYGNIGFVHLQKGELEEAIEFLKKAVSLNPQFIQAISTLSSAYYMAGHFDEAIKYANEALSLDNTFAVAHNNLALCYFEKEAYDKAIEHCDLSIKHGFEVEPKFLKQLEPYR
jgi:tetratricopeptide (TPR) repeat protein